MTSLYTVTTEIYDILKVYGANVFKFQKPKDYKNSLCIVLIPNFIRGDLIKEGLITILIYCPETGELRNNIGATEYTMQDILDALKNYQSKNLKLHLEIENQTISNLYYSIRVKFQTT